MEGDARRSSLCRHCAAREQHRHEPRGRWRRGATCECGRGEGGGGQGSCRRLLPLWHVARAVANLEAVDDVFDFLTKKAAGASPLLPTD